MSSQSRPVAEWRLGTDTGVVSEVDLGELCARAAAGDTTAWATLVRDAAALLLGVARGHRLNDADASDISQSTWLSLAGTLPALRDARRSPRWLVTTARRFALRTMDRHRRELPAACCAGDCATFDRPDRMAEARALARERDQVLWQVATRLPLRQQKLLWLLAYRPDLTQAQVATRLGIAPGSVGPLRRRCLDHMRTLLRAEGIHGP